VEAELFDSREMGAESSRIEPVLADVLWNRNRKPHAGKIARTAPAR
jgi:hypothetical protein